MNLSDGIHIFKQNNPDYQLCISFLKKALSAFTISSLSYKEDDFYFRLEIGNQFIEYSFDELNKKNAHDFLSENELQLSIVLKKNFHKTSHFSSEIQQFLRIFPLENFISSQLRSYFKRLFTKNLSFSGIKSVPFDTRLFDVLQFSLTFQFGTQAVDYTIQLSRKDHYMMFFKKDLETLMNSLEYVLNDWNLYLPDYAFPSSCFLNQPVLERAFRSSVASLFVESYTMTKAYKLRAQFNPEHRLIP